jgi:hypothetical protein
MRKFSAGLAATLLLASLALPSSQTWKTFLKNHMRDMVSADFFVVPTVTFRLLFVFLVLSHDRRRVVHFGVTASPTAEWTAQQLVDAFPWESAPRYCFATAMVAMENRFHKPPKRCRFGRFSRPHVRLGRMRMSRG